MAAKKQKTKILKIKKVKNSEKPKLLKSKKLNPKTKQSKKIQQKKIKSKKINLKKAKSKKLKSKIKKIKSKNSKTKKKSNLKRSTKSIALILNNFHEHWKNPLINKYLEFDAVERLEGTLVIQNPWKENQKLIWLSHPFNINQAKKEVSPNVKVVELNKKELKKSLKGFSKIGFDSEFMSVARLNRYEKIAGKKFEDMSTEIGKNCEIKTNSEISKIKLAIKITKQAIKKLRTILREGITEKEAEEFLEKCFEENGCQKAFIIVAFGENTANIHHAVTNKVLRFEEPVLIDAGAKYKGYCADITESFWFGNKPPEEYMEMVAKCESFLAIAPITLVEGNSTKLLETKSKVLGKLTHSLGHGIGTEVHDFPKSLSPTKKGHYIFKKGMVFAIEPGVYSERFGVRLERDFLVVEKSIGKAVEL
jgi:Xaa-Pro aminopeptidase